MVKKKISSVRIVHNCYSNQECVWEFRITNLSSVRSHICLSVCLFVDLFVFGHKLCVCVSLCPRRVEWMLWAFLRKGGVCWNVEFGHAADALPPNTLQTEWTDGRPSGRARGVGFALRPWESLWLTSPARGSDLTGLYGNERSEKWKLTWSAVHKSLC